MCRGRVGLALGRGCCKIRAGSRGRTGDGWVICCLPPQSTLLTLHTLTLRKAPRGGRVREMVGIVLESALHLPPSLMLHHTMPPWPNGQGLTTDQEIGVLRLLVALRFVRFGVLRPTVGYRPRFVRFGPEDRGYVCPYELSTLIDSHPSQIRWANKCQGTDMHALF